ncbi:Tripartite motif-containing protein 2 [Amphibalanus amphitrite]|uniref:Tripartite motif-containing protein 2 n=1 Tax=Amphibalanus amphitrite TaxID=1232801 RepID=A0A6A4W969_AMPAM|nr:Tripartite motif-containing protein 2 [Amphibalanus amphitrite]
MPEMMADDFKGGEIDLLIGIDNLYRIVQWEQVSGLQTNRLLAVEPDSCTACAGTGTCPTCVAVAAEESRNPGKESSDSDSDSGSESESDVTQESSRRRRGADWQLYCSNHAGQTLRFFCRDCETAVCASCTDILHAQHSTCRLSETGAEQRQALLALRQRVSSQMDVERRRRALLSAAGGQLHQARLQAEQDLQAYCDSLVQAVHRRKEALTGLLAQIYRDRVSDIEHQLARLDSFLTELDSCERHMERALDSGTDTEVLLLNKQVTVRVGGQQLLQQRQQADAEHAGELRFEASNTDRLEAQLASFGSFRAGPEPPEPVALLPSSDVSSERSSAERVPARRSLSGSAASPSVVSTGSRGSGASQPSSRRSSRRSVPPPIPPAEDDLVLSIGEKGRGRGEFSNPQA